MVRKDFKINLGNGRAGELQQPLNGIFLTQDSPSVLAVRKNGAR